ncbi:MAG: hypothetical protein CNF01_08890 [Halieaceae bacterium MED-G27]|nr:MAG: hypothetical protein CNF01_08890 [Halieaceae bacterium MED-G27]
MKKIVMSAALVTSMLAGSTALSQEENVCDGVVSILRISNYVGAGSETGLREASAKHDAWYKSHGVTENKQVVIPLLEYDRDTDSFTKDTARVATFHLNSVASAKSREHIGDNAWNEFIAIYNENTEVTESVIACLPKSLFSQ